MEVASSAPSVTTPVTSLLAYYEIDRRREPTARRAYVKIFAPPNDVNKISGLRGEEIRCKSGPLSPPFCDLQSVHRDHQRGPTPGVAIIPDRRQTRPCTPTSSVRPRRLRAKLTCH